MDLMRTLLIYMSATLTLAVQSTSAPKETPTPSPAPIAIVETAETPGPGEPAATAVPAEKAGQSNPGEKITPFPVPAITPNTKAYHNLTMGTKGKEVRRMQEKLIELGYLPEGAADGAYGRQTYNAVKKFQYYNGLTADGIAGRKTQTYLFENPDIAANPETANTVIATPEVTEAPETPAPPTEAPETEAPATEVPVTEVPVIEVPVTEVPVTEAPATEVPPTEAPATAAPATEAPEEETPAPEEPEAAEEPAATEEPAEVPEVTEEPEEDITEVIENVDLDADEYELITGVIALNEGKGPLEFIAMEDGVPVTARPRLSQNGSRIRVSLDDMCKCADGWQLTDDGVGSVVLEAAGYTLALYNEDKGCSATVDGTDIPMKDEDYDFVSEGHFINVEFLAAALKGEAVWDQEEETLMLRIRDKDAAEAAD